MIYGFFFSPFLLVPVLFIGSVRVSNGLQGILEGILRFLPKRRMPYFVDSKNPPPCARTPTHRVRITRFLIVLEPSCNLTSEMFSERCSDLWEAPESV